MRHFDIMETVESYTGVSIEKMKSRTRKKPVVAARHISMYLMYKNTNLVYETIGDLFDRDHSSVIHACQEIEKWMFTDKKFKAMILEIEKIVSEIDHEKMASSTPVYDINFAFKSA